MNKLRFSTVQDLFDAFPTAREDVGEAVPSEPSINFLRRLIDQKDWEPAISFCAYLLPKRAAVAWGCRSLRRAFDRLEANEEKALGFAEAWVNDPEEIPRRKALALGNLSNHKASATWLALAAGWSGGNIVPSEFGVAQAAPEQTAQAVRISLFIALSKLPDDDADGIMTACIQDGIQLARGETSSSR